MLHKYRLQTRIFLTVKTYKTWTRFKSRTVCGHDGEAQHQTTITFTGKINVLNSKTQKYMFWSQKINTLSFFSSYIILNLHKERYPFVISKSKAACVLHEVDHGGTGWHLTARQWLVAVDVTDELRHWPALPVGFSSCVFATCCLFSFLLLSACWNHSVGRRFFCFLGAYCKSDQNFWVRGIATVWT